jgi:hypothetical protein
MTVLTAQVGVACDDAIERAFERAATKVITAGRREVTLRDRMRSTSKERVLSTVRPDELETLGLNGTLFAGAWDRLALKVRVFLTEPLEEAGIDRFTADERAAVAASRLCALCEEWTRQNLHRPLEGHRHVPYPDIIRIVGDALSCALAA